MSNQSYWPPGYFVPPGGTTPPPPLNSPYVVPGTQFSPITPPIAPRGPSTPPGKLGFGGWAAWVVVLLVTGTIAGSNWYAQQNPSTPSTTSAAHEDARGSGPFRFFARYTIGADSLTGGIGGPDQKTEFRRLLTTVAQTPADHLHEVIIDAELDERAAPHAQRRTADRAARNMGQMQKALGDPELAEDAGLFRQIYAGGPEKITGEEQDRLIQRHEWFARLALGFGRADSDVNRRAALAAARDTAIRVMGFGIVVLLGLGAGIGLFITAIVLWSTRRLQPGYRRMAWGDGSAEAWVIRGHAPAADITATLQEAGEGLGYRGVFMEAFAVFLLLYFLLSLGLGLIAHHMKFQPPLALQGSLPAAAAVIACLWPRLRGVGGAEFRRAVGLNRGRGIFREILCGMLGYLAGLPLIGIGILVVQALMKRSGALPPSHPIVNSFGQGPSALATIYVLACIIAPLTEEIVFRGMFFHHLRQRHSVLASAVTVGFFFAAIHPQGWVAIPALGCIGVVLALLREWRGSIIASMTAHALNNFVVVTFAAAVFS